MKKILAVILIVFWNSGLSVYAQNFSEIDNLIDNAISNKYFPGAALLIGDNNSIIYENYYGNFTYDDDSKKIDKNSLFDLASLTKVIATTSAIMHLYDAGKISLDSPVKNYIPDFGSNNKENITVRNLLLHNSGLKAWIPFYKTCINKSDVLNTIYSLEPEYSTGTKFVYSDLNFILLGHIVEVVSGMDLSEYCEKYIFNPLDMGNTFFNPSDEKKKFCVPTEYDGVYRKKQLQGEVHDEAAYVMGGISGNAGLFSNTVDIYKLVNTVFNYGTYYNPYTRNLRLDTLFTRNTVELFLTKYTSPDYFNTRALGWDTKQEAIGKYRSQCGELISENCFGHTGYTGTSVWCDRYRNIIIIFLTNRVYPTRDNDGIRILRPELHNLIINTLTNK